MQTAEDSLICRVHERSTACTDDDLGRQRFMPKFHKVSRAVKCHSDFLYVYKYIMTTNPITKPCTLGVIIHIIIAASSIDNDIGK